MRTHGENICYKTVHKCEYTCVLMLKYKKLDKYINGLIHHKSSVLKGLLALRVHEYNLLSDMLHIGNSKAI
jgi:hypothetical protein